ncbi:hypothetical protein DdX_17309 [Ditylenchus destructor]|uniref:Galectin n=1 Tax=Ditylenchus destructor TaxID=166010 RepID=A0AAD4MPA2_9BILA|nr:hypothetical protein DdX_17309 [Ditylenchus destructor]
MILILLCAALFVGFGAASNVIPHVPFPYPPQIKTPLTLRDPIQPGTLVWITGLFYNNVYNNDLKIYVIAGGNGEYNDQLKAVVLEIRANHDEDKISYGSLSHWGGEWNYAADSKNPVRDGVRSNVGYDFVLEFKDNVIVVWVNGHVLSIYPYSATIHDLSEITGVHIPQNDELGIMLATHRSTTSFGSFPYTARFDPPLSKGKQYLGSYGMIHCGEYANNDVEYIFHNSSVSPKNWHFGLIYNCKQKLFGMQAAIDGKAVGLQTKKYEIAQVKNGVVLFFEVDTARVKVSVNGEDLFDFPHQVDIEKYPVTDLDILSSKGRFSMSILVMVDKPS